MKANLPTKSDLLQTNIVAIDLHHKKVVTSSIQITDHFGKRHSNVIRRVTALIKKDLLKIEANYYLDQYGRDQKYYELNRDQFLLVVMGFTGDKADQFKANFIQLFNQQEAELQQWQTGRLIATDTTKQANDQIQLLKQDLLRVDPSSNKARFLYPNIQKAINKAITGIYGSINRNTLPIDQLSDIGQLEQQVEAEIERLRHEGVAPEQVRDDVLTMIKAVGKKEAPTATKLEGAFHNAA